MNAKEKMTTYKTTILCNIFECLDGNHTENAATVRGWIMDELERRDACKFEAWMDCDDVDAMNMPSKFFS